ncbi:hypothetical protein OKB57_25035 (plasmid) [Serratia marcescens]|nr:hypothetical protein [Serratia marcescens]UYY70162.1 hypothetical protein OKB57_25035 [Serratia marcescens]
MSNLNNEDFNAIMEAGFINEWKKPGCDEVRYYINTKEDNEFMVRRKD